MKTLFVSYVVIFYEYVVDVCHMGNVQMYSFYSICLLLLLLLQVVLAVAVVVVVIVIK